MLVVLCPLRYSIGIGISHCSLCLGVLIFSHFVSSPLNSCLYIFSIIFLILPLFDLPSSNPCLWVGCCSLPPASFWLRSSLNSVNSSDSRGSSGSHSHSPSSSSSSSSSHHLFQNHHPRHRYRSSTLPQQTPARLSSISSHDSGFISSSQDQNTSSSPMSAESKVRKTTSKT